MLSLLPVELWDYKFKDIFRGLSAALNSANPNKVLNINGLGYCIPTRSARVALIVAMKALDLRPNAMIGVPFYCCPVVFKAIKAAGCTPRFIDIDPKTYCLSLEDVSKKCRRLDALIAVHMFGNMCDMPGILGVMNGRPVIEDCAQSIGSKLQGSLAGSFGTVAIFSFRSGKYLSAGEGGALFSSNADLRSQMSKINTALPTPDLKEEFLHILMTYLRSKLRSRPLWGMIGYSLWDLYNTKVDVAAKSPIVLSQIFRSDLAIARDRIGLMDSRIEAQRANAEYYARHLQLNPGMLCSERPGTYYNRYSYPIMFPSSEQRDLMAACLLSSKIGTLKPYQEVIEGAAEYYGYEGDCPGAEQIIKRALLVPNNYGIEQKVIRRIARRINRAWTDIANRDNSTFI